MKSAVKSVYKLLASNQECSNDSWFNLKNDIIVLSKLNSALTGFLKVFDNSTKPKVRRIKVAKAIGKGLKLR